MRVVKRVAAATEGNGLYPHLCNVVDNFQHLFLRYEIPLVHILAKLQIVGLVGAVPAMVRAGVGGLDPYVYRRQHLLFLQRQGV